MKIRDMASRNALFEVYATTLRGLLSDLRQREAPITQWVLLAICLVVLGQTVAAVYLHASILGVTSYFFLEYPIPAWSLSFFLHRDVLHFLANIALIGLIGRVVEQDFSSRAYLWFLAGSAILSGIGGYAFRAAFTSGPVAAYGASGFGFALATYSLALPFRGGHGIQQSLSPESLLANTSPAERFVFLLGISAVLKVLLNLLTGPFFTVDWTNGAHLVGALVGITVGRIHSPSNSTALSVG